MLLVAECLRPLTFSEIARRGIREALEGCDEEEIQYSIEFAETVSRYRETIVPDIDDLSDREEIIVRLGFLMHRMWLWRECDHYYWSKAQVRSRTAWILLALYFHDNEAPLCASCGLELEEHPMYNYRRRHGMEVDEHLPLLHLIVHE